MFQRNFQSRYLIKIHSCENAFIRGNHFPNATKIWFYAQTFQTIAIIGYGYACRYVSISKYVCTLLMHIISKCHTFSKAKDSQILLEIWCFKANSGELMIGMKLWKWWRGKRKWINDQRLEVEMICSPIIRQSD